MVPARATKNEKPARTPSGIPVQRKHLAKPVNAKMGVDHRLGCHQQYGSVYAPIGVHHLFATHDRGSFEQRSKASHSAED